MWPTLLGLSLALAFWNWPGSALNLLVLSGHLAFCIFTPLRKIPMWRGAAHRALAGRRHRRNPAGSIDRRLGPTARCFAED